jgi:hypothetical protein
MHSIQKESIGGKVWDDYQQPFEFTENPCDGRRLEEKPVFAPAF